LQNEQSSELGHLKEQLLDIDQSELSNCEPEMMRLKSLCETLEKENQDLEKELERYAIQI
jgi:hypothetical protein